MGKASSEAYDCVQQMKASMFMTVRKPLLSDLQLSFKKKNKIGIISSGSLGMYWGTPMEKNLAQRAREWAS